MDQQAKDEAPRDTTRLPPVTEATHEPRQGDPAED